MSFASPSDSTSQDAAQREWNAVATTLANIGGEDSMAATVAFTLFLRHPRPELAHDTLKQYFDPLRQDLVQGEFDLVGVWAHGLSSALYSSDQAHLGWCHSFETLVALRTFLVDEGLTDVWLHSLLPRDVDGFLSKKAHFSKPTPEWTQLSNNTWWGQWLASTDEYNSKRHADFFLTDVARVDPTQVVNPFFTHQPSQSSFAYALSLVRKGSQHPVFSVDELRRFWEQLLEHRQTPMFGLLPSVTLVPALILNRSPSEMLSLCHHSSDLAYACFRGVAALDRVADGFPTAHHHAVESFLDYPEVQQFIRNQCVLEHRRSGPYQDWLDRLALKITCGETKFLDRPTPLAL
jgi:hypothetical protein